MEKELNKDNTKEEIQDKLNKKERKTSIEHRIFVLGMITAIAFIITAFAVNFMPDTVPMHYNMQGEIDRYGSKNENYLFPVMIALFNVFWIVMIAFYNRKVNKEADEKKKEEAKSNSKILYWAAIGTSVLFTGMQCIFLMMDVNSADSVKPVNFDMANMFITVAMGISFIFLGNIMPKTKLNGLVGLRTTWSMANDTTWRLSNRFGGKAMIVCGVVTIFCGFFFKGVTSSYAMLAVLMIMVIVCVIYSYKVYQKYGKRDENH